MQAQSRWTGGMPVPLGVESVGAHDTATETNAQQRLEMIATLALAGGSRGMAGGQAMDMAMEMSMSGEVTSQVETE